MSIHEHEEKISITGLFSMIYKEKLLLAFFIAGFLGIGLFIYFLSPKEYKTSAVLLPESNTSNIGGIGNLASLAGVNLGRMATMDRTLSPNVYQDIIKSTPFLNELVSTSYYFPSIEKECTLADYLVIYSEPTFWEKMGNIFRKNPQAKPVGPLDSLTGAANISDSTEVAIFSNTIFQPLNRTAIVRLNNRIIYNTNLSTGLITISLDLQDPDVGARVLQEIIAQLINISQRYSGQRDSTSIEQLDRQILDRKKEYEAATRRLASFQDQNRGLILSIDKTAIEQLQNDVTLSRNIYTSLLQQREQISIQSKSQKAPISIIEPVQIASGPYTPRLLKTFIISIFMGIFVGSCFILTRKSILTIIR